MVRGKLILKVIRAARGMSQQYIADAHGVSVSTIKRWENGITPVPFDDLIWITTDICKISLFDAMELASNEKNSRCAI